MTDVITYRTENGEELKKLAKERNISLSQLTNDIVNYYFEFFDLRTKANLLKSSSETISHCFSLISESDVLKTTDLCCKVITRHIKTVTNDFSLANMIKIFLNYYKYNNFEYSEFDEPDYIKIVCKNTMSKNWNEYLSIGITKCLNHFGLNAVEDSFEDGIHSYKISKQKHS